MATVVSCDPGTMMIEVAPDGEHNLARLQAIPLVSVVASALGFHETLLPGVGTRVLCQGRGDSTMIVGCLPYAEAQGDPKVAVMPCKAILGYPDAQYDSVHRNGLLGSSTKLAVMNNNLPTDVTQGEKVISNEFGVMMGLFKLMATLKASELAQIQVHFLDDLVRIISHNFQHYTSLGQTNIFHDGQGIHMEVGASHIPAESMGQSTDKSGITEIPYSNSNTKDPNNPTAQFTQFYKLSSEQLVMLERMKLFVGKLGEFINLIIVKPADRAHKVDGTIPDKPDTGLLQLKANLDGSLVVRSASGIYLEKTNWIRVPERIRTPEDPTGDDGSTLEYSVKPAYVFDTTYAYRETAFLYYLQLRDYLAWIDEGVGYANFRTQTKDFYVNNDKTKETPLSSITLVDPETGCTYTQTKSWISLMNNGGVSIADAWGSCISMEGGNIYIQPAKDLILQPNGNLIGKIGGEVGLAVQGDIDLSSTKGGMRAKTHEAQYLYSSNSGIVLQSDGKATTNGYQYYPDSNSSNKLLQKVSGIVLKATNSTVSSYASQIYDDATSILVQKAPSITSQSTDVTQILSKNQVFINSNFLSLTSNNETINYSTGDNIMLGLSHTTVGIKNQTFGVAAGLGPVQGLQDPNNKQDQNFFTFLSTITDTMTKFDLATVLLTFKTDQNFKDIQFQFPASSWYSLGQYDIIPQTLSQQTDAISGSPWLKTWAEEPVNGTYPYPGLDKAMSLVTIDVHNVTNVNNELTNKVNDLIPQSTVKVSNIFTQYKSI